MQSNKSATKRKPRTKSDDSADTALRTTWQPKIVPELLAAIPVRVEQTLEEAFPHADHGMQPFGSRVLIQVRTPREKSAGGIILTSETQDTEKWNTTIAKIIAIGPGAFKNRDTLQVWPEGEWCKVGDFVWAPKYGGQRHEVKIRGQSVQKAMFVTVNDLDLIGACTIDPLSVVMWV